jgi:hypothetical protein
MCHPVKYMLLPVCRRTVEQLIVIVAGMFMFVYSCIVSIIFSYKMLVGLSIVLFVRISLLLELSSSCSSLVFGLVILLA